MNTPGVPCLTGRGSLNNREEGTSDRHLELKIIHIESVNAVFVPPKSVNCPLCNEQHTFLYYCSVFLAAPLVDRRQPGGRSRACFRCLRLDSKVDFKNQEQYILDFY